MGDIGRKTPTGSLFLPQVGDWTYSYTLADGSDHLDPTWRLYLLVGESEWDFVIALAEALSSLPQETLDALKTALGLA